MSKINKMIRQIRFFWRVFGSFSYLITRKSFESFIVHVFGAFLTKFLEEVEYSYRLIPISTYLF